MKCAFCDEEHASVILSPKCHPGKPLEVSMSEHPENPQDNKTVLLEMRCSKCGAHVARYTAQRVFVN